MTNRSMESRGGTPDRRSNEEIAELGKNLYIRTKEILTNTPEFLKASGEQVVGVLDDSTPGTVAFNKNGKEYSTWAQKTNMSSSLTVQYFEDAEVKRKIKFTRNLTDFFFSYSEKGKTQEENINEQNNEAAVKKIEDFLTDFTGHF